MSLCIILHQLLATLLPYTTLFRSGLLDPRRADRLLLGGLPRRLVLRLLRLLLAATLMLLPRVVLVLSGLDRKSTRLNSSHVATSYAACCFKQKTSSAYHSDAITAAATPCV